MCEMFDISKMYVDIILINEDYLLTQFVAAFKSPTRLKKEPKSFFKIFI